ncbi:MAG: YibE/F family protein [Clostridiales Family XIII bacterium]|jgi:uncharacterized membrane protein|nr:YibE/F family protein [Clostridiales Family XIII bacterium]
MSKRAYRLASCAAIILLAMLFLFVGNRIAMRDMPDLNNKYGSYQTVEAKVTEIHDTINSNVLFEAVVIRGANHSSIMAIQNTNQNYLSGAKRVEVGDKVVISRYWDSAWEFVEYVRIDKIALLAAAFVALLLIFGRVKGLNAVLALGLTCAAIFAVFLPSLLSGKNIYVSSVVTCVFSVVVTLLIVNGADRKSFSAIMGCLGGVVAIGVLTFVMNKALGITGVLNKDSMLFLYLFKTNPIDLKAVIFAGVMIGAVGAVMDVAMSISSALWELKSKAAHLNFGGLVGSGINISRDIMGTMANTLVLAYVGNSLSVIVLLSVYVKSLAELVNREMVIVELLQAVIGSFGILLTMPLTTLICAALYSKPPLAKQDDAENVS